MPEYNREDDLKYGYWEEQFLTQDSVALKQNIDFLSRDMAWTVS